MDEIARAAQWGVRLQTLVRHKGWSARELARRANLAPSTAAMVLRGEAVKLTAKSQRLLALALGWPDWDTMMDSTELEPPVRPGAQEREAERLALARRLIEMANALIGGVSDGGTNANVNYQTGDTAVDTYRTVQMAGSQHSARERTGQGAPGRRHVVVEGTTAVPLAPSLQLQPA